MRQRVTDETGWILHTQPWRETSLIVQVFSRGHGRVALVAKGAKRPGSAMRGALMTFQPLSLDWSGGGEVKTLVRCDWRGGWMQLGGQALFCGYYTNELILKLTAREDPHPGLFDAYERFLTGITSGRALAPLLRAFELTLLKELGYGLMLAADCDGQPFQAAEPYLYLPERGPRRVAATDRTTDGIPVQGQTLLDLAAGEFTGITTLAESQRLLRGLIEHQLAGQVLQSRRIFRELQAF